VSESLHPKADRDRARLREAIEETQRITRARQLAVLEKCAAAGRLPIADFREKAPAPRERYYPRRYQTPPLVAARAQLERAGYRVERQ